MTHLAQPTPMPDAPRPGRLRPWVLVSWAFGATTILFAVAATLQLNAAIVSTGGLLYSESIGLLPSILLALAEGIMPLLGMLLGRHDLVALTHSIEVVTVTLVLLGGGFLVLPRWPSKPGAINGPGE